MWQLEDKNGLRNGPNSANEAKQLRSDRTGNVRDTPEGGGNTSPQKVIHNYSRDISARFAREFNCATTSHQGVGAILRWFYVEEARTQISYPECSRMPWQSVPPLAIITLAMGGVSGLMSLTNYLTVGRTDRLIGLDEFDYMLLERDIRIRDPPIATVERMLASNAAKTALEKAKAGIAVAERK